MRRVGKKKLKKKLAILPLTILHLRLEIFIEDTAGQFTNDI